MIKKHLDEGTLVPTDVTMELIKDRILSTKDGVLLLDGYPRNMSNYKVRSPLVCSLDLVRSDGDELPCPWLLAVPVQLRISGEATVSAGKRFVFCQWTFQL